MHQPVSWQAQLVASVWSYYFVRNAPACKSARPMYWVDSGDAKLQFSECTGQWQITITGGNGVYDIDEYHFSYHWGGAGDPQRSILVRLHLYWIFRCSIISMTWWCGMHNYKPASSLAKNRSYRKFCLNILLSFMTIVVILLRFLVQIGLRKFMSS